MRKVVLVSILITILAFSYNTVLGNRGTYKVYSGACEDMGMLTFNLNAYGAMVNIDSMIPAETTSTSAQLTEILPYMAVSFTPWHYLEFSLWGHGRYATFGNYSSSVSELYNNLGLSVKGGVPIYFAGASNSYIAPGIEGFAYMQGIGTNTFGFGGRGLLTFNFAWFGFHLNGGYESISGPTSTGNVLTGVGLEFWPFPWGGIIVDGTANMPQNALSNFTSYLHVTPGFRFAFGSRSVKFNINLGCDLEPMQQPLRWHGLAGFGIGFDVMPPAEGYIKGIVLDRITQEPVAGAKVYIEGRPGDIYVTEADGRFSVGYPEGSFFLAAEHPDYVTARVSSDLIALEGGTVMIELAPAGGARVVGILADADSDSPIGGFVRFISVGGDTFPTAFKSDPVSGYYRAEIPAGTYRITAEASGYKSRHKSMIIEEADELVIDFKLERAAPVIPAPFIAFRSVYFGRGESGLSPYDYTPLEEAVSVLKANPEVRVQLNGYTDSVGDAQSNYQLSIRRAQSVRDFLVRNGVSANRITVVGYGESSPRGDNRTNRGRDMNRRVDIIVI
jgi:outer membrane protein OmpA-like peptidoglycan-associated protein